MESSENHVLDSAFHIDSSKYARPKNYPFKHSLIFANIKGE